MTRPADLTAALLAAVYAEPAADAPRQVLADHLIEEGDERGEFIALQLARARTPGARPSKREQSLLKKHAAAWSGALDGLLAKQMRGFERGFLASGRADGQWRSNMRYVLRPATGAVEWATVERFACPHYWSNAGYMSELTTGLFTDPAMRSLRVLHNIPMDLAQAIEASVSAPPLVEIGVDDGRAGAGDALGTRGLRGVRRLVISHVISTDNLAWLWTSPLLEHLEALTLIGYQQEPLDRLDDFLATILEHAPPTLGTIGFMGQTRFPLAPEGWHVELTRVQHELTALDATFGACSYGYAIVGDSLAEVLDRIDPSLTAIRIHDSAAYKPSDEQRARLAAACKHFRKLASLDVPA